jgi:energy-coupling factor transporter ATP-binding protein EcfA2
VITELSIENFRGFEQHVVPLRQLTIGVGKNNAGKSSVVEALRLVSLVANRYQALNYHELPNWLDRPRRQRGVFPSTDGLEINNDGIFHRYGGPPGRIVARFSTGEELEILIGPDADIVGIIKDNAGDVIRTKGEARKIHLPQVAILPQIGPLLRDEHKLDSTYVRQSMASSRSSLHFRNQLFFQQIHFEAFKKVAQDTWPGLAVKDLNAEKLSPTDTALSLLIRDTDFTAEVGWMGHGLQMWLQMMWFLTHSAEASSVILDEPDVYMHPDLQRRLIRLLRSRNHQTIIATHSVEIMSEVDPDEILIIDRKHRHSYFAGKQPVVQKLLESIGTIHNIQLARLGITRRFLMIEGDDMDFLKRFQNALFPRSQTPIDTIPHRSIGGWDGWERAVGCAGVLKDAAGGAIKPYCILDSDYHTPSSVQKRKNSARTNGIALHVWKRKEIENYLLVPSLIRRVIERGAKRNTVLPSIGQIHAKLNEMGEALRMVVFNGMANEFLTEDRSLRLHGANQAADKRLKPIWSDAATRLASVSGKEVIHRLSAWAKTDYGVSFSATKLAKEITADELDGEVKAVLGAIESGSDF